MTNKAKPLSKFLLPIDGKGTYNSACMLAGKLASMLDDRVQAITLLHVMAGRYLSSHMANIDIRVDYVLKSETFKRLRRDFIHRDIEPLLDEAEKIIESMRPKAQINKKILDGKPDKTIIKFATENNYSTIVMQRRCMDPVKGSIIGSVASGILYGKGSSSVYVPGANIFDKGTVTINTLLIPVDGSKGSIASVKEASVLLNASPDIKTILLNVLDVVDLANAAEKNLWSSPIRESEGILKQAEDILVESGVSIDRIEKKTATGDPADVITREAEDRQVDIIFIGRTERSAISEIFVGSVGRAVLGRCFRTTLAVVNPERE